jgi:hypothetical protein
MYLTGALLGVASLMVMAGPASAAFQNQTLTNSTTPTKVSSKTRAGVSLFTSVDTQYQGTDAPNGGCPITITNCRFFPPANRTVLDFDNDYAFTSGTIPACTTNLVPLSTDQAKAACPKSIVGQGSSVIRTLAGDNGPTLNAVVTAFVGAKEGGNDVLLLHADPGPTVTSKPVLKGVLGNSPLGGDFGKRLDVTVPITTGTAITHFDTTINKVVAKKKTKKLKNGKKKVIKTFFASARCADKDKKWNITETTSFGPNQTTVSETHSAASIQTCKPVVAKKKKK